MEKREAFCKIDGNVNWYSHFGEQHGDFVKNNNNNNNNNKNKRIKLMCDLTTPLLGLYSESESVSLSVFFNYLQPIREAK